MKEYVVFECRRTLELCQIARQKGYGSWIPMLTVKRLRSPKNKAPYLEEVRECAMPGYLYVPYEDWISFMRWVPTRYNAKILMMQGGTTGLAKHVASDFRYPARVHIRELQIMDEILKRGPSPINPALKTIPKPAQFVVGRPVAIIGGVFSGMVGKVNQIGKKGISVLLGPRIVWINPVLLRDVV